MINNVKQLYWRTKYTKGKNIFWLLRALYYQVFTTLRPVFNGATPHNLNSRLIVSLTSYPPRFNKLFLTLKCLVCQTVKPDEVVLWVTKDDLSKLPKNVLQLHKKQLIRIKTTLDLGPGKKLIPALSEYKDSFIVTADDDIYYHKDWLIDLIKDFSNQKTIIAHRVHKIKYDSGVIQPYKSWDFDVTTPLAQKNHFLTGGAGALFPPNCFYQEVINIERYLKCTAKQDDIWIYWMLRLNGYTVKPSKSGFELITWNGSDDCGLANENVVLDKNDIAIKQMLAKYGDPNRPVQEA